MVSGDRHCEAYTAIMRGVGLSHEIPNVAEAEAVTLVEGKMCGAVMRGAGRSAGVEGHFTSERNTSEPGRSHDRPMGKKPRKVRIGKARSRRR